VLLRHFSQAKADFQTQAGTLETFSTDDRDAHRF
jgi:hypothetical protein